MSHDEKNIRLVTIVWFRQRGRRLGGGGLFAGGGLLRGRSGRCQRNRHRECGNSERKCWDSFQHERSLPLKADVQAKLHFTHVSTNGSDGGCAWPIVDVV